MIRMIWRAYFSNGWFNHYLVQGITSSKGAVSTLSDFFPECAWKGVPMERCIWTHVPSTSINSAVGTHLHGEVIDAHVQSKRYKLLVQKAVFTSPVYSNKKKNLVPNHQHLLRKNNDFSFPTSPILFGVGWESPFIGSEEWNLDRWGFAPSSKSPRSPVDPLSCRSRCKPLRRHPSPGVFHQKAGENKGVGMRKVNQLGSMGLVIFPKILAMKINHSCR